MGDGLDRSGGSQGTGSRPVAPTVFVSHGSPLVALDSDAYPQALKAFGDGEGGARALVVVSAHWETSGEVRVTASTTPPLVYDFYGFPEPLYRIRYTAPGAPEIARKASQLLKQAGFTAAIDGCRGLDHGAWAPLL